MTYDRLKAKIIPGEHCRFCGNDSVPPGKNKKAIPKIHFTVSLPCLIFS